MICVILSFGALAIAFIENFVLGIFLLASIWITWKIFFPKEIYHPDSGV